MLCSVSKREYNFLGKAAVGILETDNYDGRLNVFVNLRFLLKVLKIIVRFFFIETDVSEF